MATDVLASDRAGPSVLLVLRVQLHLEPLVTADADGLRKALKILGEALGPQLRFSANSARGTRVVEYAPTQLDGIPAGLGAVLAPSRASFRRHLESLASGPHLDVAFKGGEGAAPGEEACTASRWTLAFWSEADTLDDDGTYVAPALLTFSVPLHFDLARLERLVHEVASCLRVRWGNAGHGFSTWEYFSAPIDARRLHADHHAGFDIGDHVDCMSRLNERIRSVSWLTFLGGDLWEQLSPSSRSRIEEDFVVRHLGALRVVRATERPEPGDGRRGSPARYAALDALLRSIRMTTGLEGEPWEPAELDSWLARFEEPATPED